VIVAENPPVELLVVVVWVSPSYETVIVEDAKNPVPITVTDFPVAPFTGVIVILGVSTLKLAEAEFELASEAVTA